MRSVCCNEIIDVVEKRYTNYNHTNSHYDKSTFINNQRQHFNFPQFLADKGRSSYYSYYQIIPPWYNERKTIEIISIDNGVINFQPKFARYNRSIGTTAWRLNWCDVSPSWSSSWILIWNTMQQRLPIVIDDVGQRTTTARVCEIRGTCVGRGDCMSAILFKARRDVYF